MVKKIASLFIVMLFISPYSFGQGFIISGKVTDKATGKAVPSASVFLSNTSIGTAANDKGGFILHNIPAGKFDLIVSSLGYETYALSIDAGKTTDALQVQLTAKANELASVVVGNYEKDGWAKWGQTFLNEFIGTTYLANGCTIKNHDAIKFLHSTKRDLLEAFADEPLVIENSGLGYVIHYKLEKFSIDFKNSSLYYAGYPLFEEMTGNARKQKKWQERRQEAYYGSIMHFMRCVFTNSLAENGYEIRRLEKQVNAEKKRVQELYTYLAGADNNMDFESHLPKDSLAYYSKILKQPSVIDILHSEILPANTISFPNDSTSATLFFNDYLYIIYKNKKEPTEYQQKVMNGTHSPGGYITSEAARITEKPVYVFYNGAFYEPQNFITLGYWAWSEKICQMLPFDYKPQ